MADPPTPEWDPTTDADLYQNAQGREWFCGYCERQVKKPEDHELLCPRRHDAPPA